MDGGRAASRFVMMVSDVETWLHIYAKDTALVTFLLTPACCITVRELTRHTMRCSVQVSTNVYPLSRRKHTVDAKELRSGFGIDIAPLAVLELETVDEQVA